MIQYNFEMYQNLIFTFGFLFVFCLIAVIGEFIWGDFK